eukprot:Nk52_evm15s292 gene=Nk52_evmTU15s292
MSHLHQTKKKKSYGEEEEEEEERKSIFEGNDKDLEEFRKATASHVALVVFGCLLLGIGAYCLSLLLMGSGRVEKVQQYNDIVEEWNMIHSDRFASIVPYVSVDNTTFFPVLPDYASDDLDDVGSDLKSYAVHKFRLFGGIFSSPQRWKSQLHQLYVQILDTQTHEEVMSLAGKQLRQWEDAASASALDKQVPFEDVNTNNWLFSTDDEGSCSGYNKAGDMRSMFSLWSKLTSHKGAVEASSVRGNGIVLNELLEQYEKSLAFKVRKDKEKKTKKNKSALVNVNFEVPGDYEFMRTNFAFVGERKCRVLNSGHFDRHTGMCTFYDILQRICLKLDYNELTKSFYLPSGSSCKCDYTARESVIYKRVRINSFKHSRPQGKVDFSGFQLMVRSVKDPYLAAIEMTNFELYFGMAVGEIIYSAIMSIICGALFTGVGFWFLKCVPEFDEDIIKVAVNYDRERRKPGHVYNEKDYNANIPPQTKEDCKRYVYLRSKHKQSEEQNSNGKSFFSFLFK